MSIKNSLAAPRVAEARVRIGARPELNSLRYYLIKVLTRCYIIKALMCCYPIKAGVQTGRALGLGA